MAIQTLIDGATSLTIDKQVPTSMSISRGQKLRTQSRSISIYKFVVGLNPGLTYDTAITRALLNDYDVQGKITEEVYVHRMQLIKNADLIDSADDYFEFVLLHELHHTTNLQKAGETTAKYEKRIDVIASYRLFA